MFHAGIATHQKRPNKGMDQWQYGGFVLGNTHPGKFGITRVIPPYLKVGRQWDGLTRGWRLCS